ncbi:MAG: hypothetical protein LIP28_04260, partial [Deltaproteobacteria bacterium]|nr:hypothetical protein [Deltaproteobacteria bacterium]
RIAGTLAPNRVEGPNLLALAHATARTFILLHSKSRKSATVTVTIVLVDEGGEPTMEARVRDALLHPDRLALYEKTALREKGILDTLDTLMPRPGGVSPLSGKSSAETIKALINELRALAIFTHLLPSRNGLWKDPAAVRDAMQEALLFAPGSSLCRNALGDAWLQLGRSQEAMEEQSLAIKADPAFARAYHSRGAAAMALGLLSSAVADFSEAIRLSPNTASSYRARGMARHLLGETAPMCADLRHACTLGECAEFEWAVANNYCTIKR